MKTEELLRHPVWLDYTQARYVPLDDIKYRLNKVGLDKRLWLGAGLAAADSQLQERGHNFEQAGLRAQIQQARKNMGLYFQLLGQKFWLCQSACLHQKLRRIERQVQALQQAAGAVILNSPAANLAKAMSHPSLDLRYSDWWPSMFQNARIEEAISSALYEGANTTRAQAKKIIAENKTPTNESEHMVVNNYRALQWMQEHRRLPLSVDLICQLHEIITRNTLKKQDEDFAGRFRNDKVFIGEQEAAIAHHYVPAAVGEVVEQINIYTTADITVTSGQANAPWAVLPPLLAAGVLHYFIGYIHPFFDGNGRTARALFYFVCLKGGFDWLQLLSLSADLKNRGDKYEQAYQLATQYDGDLTYFVDFNLQSLIYAFARVEKKLHFVNSLKNLEHTLGLSPWQCVLLQKMVLNKHKPVGGVRGGGANQTNRASWCAKG